MLYDIRLRISYEYDRTAVAGRHLLRLTPADRAGEQRVVWSALEIDPPPEERSILSDFFGNEAVEVGFRSAHGEIEFKVDARVERLAHAPELDISPALSQLKKEASEHLALDPQAPHHFLGPSPRIRPDPAIAHYGREIVQPGMTAFEIVRAIGLALHRDIRYVAEATTVDTPPETAFARRHGVCQDFTHIMIAALRSVGVPAGYVSGFLRTNASQSQPRLEGADAMHAWVQAWCGVETGWIEFDPTNAINVGGDHIVIARGRDYSDIAPIKGVLRTSGSQTSKQAVNVVPLSV